MKVLIKTLLALSTFATAAMAQVITPVWVEHLNGEQGVTSANRLPILVKNLNKSESNDGTSEQVSLGKMLPYDSARFLLYIRENGIKETVAHDTNLAKAYPDRCLIWINAANGAPMGVAHVFGVVPGNIPITGQGNAFDFFSEWGLDDDGVIYSGHKNRLYRWAKTGTDTWSSTPTCAWTEPTVGATDCQGNPLDDSTSGDGNTSMRWREFRVTGSGTNTVLFCGGGTWRAGSQPQIFTTTNGLTFNPVGRLNNRDNGANKTEYGLGGQSTHVIHYGWDPSRPKLETVYTGHYPGTGYGARPNRYETDPDNPEHVLTPYSYSPTDSVRVLWREETATNNQPAFNWEAAGKDGLPEVPAVDGDQYYDGNWSCAMDANASLDYIVNYSMPSWNNQYPVIDGTNYHRPGWVAAHRLDGTISPNSAWKLACTEADIANSDNGGIGNDWGYAGDISVYPDTTAPANLKKATVFWVGSGYGFGVFTVQNVAAAVVSQPPASITILENDTLTISATISGSPNAYQWTKGGVALDGTKTNLDGSLHYPSTVVQGVNKPKLSVPLAQVSDSGSYKLTAVNPLGTINTINVAVTVLPDTNKPTIQLVQGLATPNANGPTPNLVKVLFNKRIDPVTGGDATKYTIAGATVSAVTLQSDSRAALLGGDWREAILVTSGLTPGQTYTLAVSGVKDQTASANVIAPASIKFKAPVLKQGLLYWDYYYLGSLPGCPDCVSSLTGNPIYPNAPMTNGSASSFDTDPITGGDLNNLYGFGPLGDNYGDSLSGWITPTVTTNYIFYLASDDHSYLRLSGDATVGAANQIAFLNGARGNFVDGPDDSVSSAQALIAGHNYFIQTLHVEGGGGDYVKVAWKMEGDTNSAASLLPIPSQYLSSYAPLIPKFNTPALSGSQLTISWDNTSNWTLQESNDLVNWTPVAGNPSSPYLVTVTSAPLKFYRLAP